MGKANLREDFKRNAVLHVSVSACPAQRLLRLKDPLSRRAREDRRQTELIRAAWSESGKVYGYRKSLADMGESRCPNRVARLTRLTGHPGPDPHSRSGHYGGKPSRVVDNTLDRRFDAEVPDKAWVTDITYIRTHEGFAFLAVVIDLFSRRVVGWSIQARQTTNVVLHALLAVATQAEGPRAGAFGSGKPIHQHGLGLVPETPRSAALEEPSG